MNEIFYVVSGTGLATLWPHEPLGPPSKIDLAPGSCLVVHKGEYHEILNNQSDQLLTLFYFGILAEPEKK
jgi:mannose-6-phosphate isomerase-like protein (cupin superfamily)